MDLAVSSKWEVGMEVFCGHCRRVVSFVGEKPKFCGHCGQALHDDLTVVHHATDDTVPPEEFQRSSRSASAETELPAVVGGYRLLRPLGGGAMGTVYEAEDPASGRRVAVKLIQPDLTESDDAIERFRQEGRLASALAHPRAVFVLAADEEAGRPYIVMELMPGSTLDDVVKERGPLPVEEALIKILDVIEGLEAAHQLGLVHRDIKPSNCFLDAAGRVKVGDFGLARSLSTDLRLTRTGTFLGTPLFAAPEQIKCEAVDAQSDVYSVAATLYYLLTGRAPFQSTDSLASLARIVSEDPPPMRQWRPELPRALERVVFWGLQRDRRRRWRSLEEFRHALAAFLPAEPSISGLGLRSAAYAIDLVALIVLENLSYWALASHVSNLPTQVAIKHVVETLIFLLYMGVLEGVWGWSPGKRLLRLRVGTVDANRPPGLKRGLLRAGIFAALFNLGPYLAEWILAIAQPSMEDARDAVVMATVGLLTFWGPVLGYALLLAPMRPLNGFRGLHEILSRTLTYRLRWPRPLRRHALARRVVHVEPLRPAGLPEHVGPYRVTGALQWGQQNRTLLAEDTRLGRRLWLWLRPVAEPALEACHRDMSRGTRARWVGCGEDGPWRWDAFRAPAGTQLVALLHAGPLSWAEARPILEDLAEELSAAAVDGTLSHALTAEDIWIQPSGHVQLLGVSLWMPSAFTSTGERDSHALALLADIAILTLEGQPRAPGTPAHAVRALVPVHAASILDRLVGVAQPYASVAELQRDLAATRDRPVEVTRKRRLGHLALTFLLLNLPVAQPVLLLTIMLLTLSTPQARGDLVSYAFVIGCTGFYVLWALLTRGGFAFYRGGIALRRLDGSKPSRLQCGLRALVVWGPVALLLCLALAVPSAGGPEESVLAWGLGMLALLWLLAGAVLALCFPRCSVHDWVAGTYLVPE
jgi:hypothetical protein